MRSILDDARLELESERFKAFAAVSPIDANKVRLELAGDTRPSSPAPYARLLIEAIRVGRAAETPTPALPPAPIDLARHVMFTAQAPEVCLGRLPGHWRVALTADPGPDGKWDTAVRAAAPKLKDAGHLVAVWGNQSQLGSARIEAVARDVGAHFVIYQAETPAEYDTAMNAGARFLVGNPNSWTQTQRDDATARANRGELVVLFEVYSNMDGVWPDTASSRGVPIATEVVGVGGWEGRPNVQLPAYKLRTPAGVWSTLSVYAGEYMDDASWAALA